MSREQFREIRFTDASAERIRLCNAIVAEYLAQGLRLTLRQLYYQLVSRNVIPNLEREYKNLSRLISDARLAGLIDWEAIEDRIRQPWSMSEFESIKDLVETALRVYRLPRWAGQENYVELWVEKDALAGVLRPLAGEYHVTMMVNRGYSSQSAMYESMDRFRQAADEGRHCILFYLGDHDPSGEDMVRDIEARMNEVFGVEVEVVKVALTMEQVRQYNPPPNPAKRSDPRAAGYIDKHGTESWEVDALPPDVLAAIIRSHLDAAVDLFRMNEVKAQEEKDKTELLRLIEQMP